MRLFLKFFEQLSEIKKRSNVVYVDNSTDITADDIINGIINNSDIYTGKIIIFGEVLKKLDYAKLSALLDKTNETLQNTGILTNFFVFLTPESINDAFSAQYSSVSKFYSIPELYSWYNNYILYNQDRATPNREFKKHFLCLNTDSSYTRLCTFFYFYRQNLLDKSYFSYFGRNPHFDPNLAEYYIDTFNVAPDATPIEVNDVVQLIPYAPNNSVTSISGNVLTRNELFETSFCSVVIDHSFGPENLLSEKIWEPIVSFQPFLWATQSTNNLSLLKQLGFETFDEIFDESYSNAALPLQLDKILNEVTKISLWSLDECSTKYKQIYQKLQHNHDHFTTILPEQFEIKMITLKSNLENTVNLVSEILV